jgi:hypothetical protein
MGTCCSSRVQVEKPMAVDIYGVFIYSFYFLFFIFFQTVGCIGHQCMQMMPCEMCWS